MTNRKKRNLSLTAVLITFLCQHHRTAIVSAYTSTSLHPQSQKIRKKQNHNFWFPSVVYSEQQQKQIGISEGTADISSSSDAIAWPQIKPLPVVGDDDKTHDINVISKDSSKSEQVLETSRDNNNNSEQSQQQRIRDFRFASPLIEFGYPPAVEEYRQNRTNDKPLLLYLPGFDQTYLSAFFQYPELNTIFDVRCLVSSMEDRSTFNEMKESVIEFILDQLTTATTTEASLSPEKEHIESNDDDPTSKAKGLAGFFRWKKSPNDKSSSLSGSQSSISKRPIYIAGESFGGILASEVALALMDDKRIDNLKGLVLINSATCYDRSRLASEGPSLTKMPKNLYLFGLLKLLPMFMDEVSFPQLLTIFQGKALPSVIDNPVREAYMGRLALKLPSLLKFMPQETLEWRLFEWLEKGCLRMTTRINELAQHDQLRCLIIAGEKDLTLPSIAEAERLAQLLPNSYVHVVDGAGHANTCGSRLDMAAVMRNHFVELRTKPTSSSDRIRKRKSKKLGDSSAEEEKEGRTQMKKVAAEGEGIYFGMEPRYDGKRIGLNPLLYWSEEYYQEI